MPSMDKIEDVEEPAEAEAEAIQSLDGKLDAFNSGNNGELGEVEVSPDSGNFAFHSGDFFDPPSALSVSSVEAEDNFSFTADTSFKPYTPKAEFFDAPEDHFEVSSESGTQVSLNVVEADVLLEEIERRKQAEETLDIMQKQWQRLAQRLSLEGLTLPPASTIAAEDEKGRLDELCQQISFARAVSNSVGREAAKAEAEMELNSKIESKNFEIARLKKRLSYYEIVNHEISSRNLEAVEMTRSPRERKRRQRWMWSSIGVSLMLGSVALAWSVVTADRGSVATKTSVSPQGDDTTT